MDHRLIALVSAPRLPSLQGVHMVDETLRTGLSTVHDSFACGAAMKLVHLSTTHRADDVRVIRKECISLGKLGHEVTVILPANEAPEPVAHVNFKLVNRPRSRFMRTTWTAFAVLCKAWRTPADVYHFHSPDLIPWMFLLLLRGQPIVYDVHEDFRTGINRAIYLPRLMAAVVAFLLRCLEHVVKHFFIIVIAEKYYVEILGKGIEVLNYPRLTDFPVINDNEVPSYGAGAEAPTLLYAGGLVRQRGALFYADLAREMPDITVQTVGIVSRGLVKEMRERARGAVNLQIEGAGHWIHYEGIMQVYQRKPILGLAIFPDSDHYRRKELTKFFEYMAAGIPIVCSDFPVWRALVVGHGVGICVDPEDTPSTIAAIRSLMLDRPRRQAMANRGRQLVEEKFNWDLEAARLDSIYRGLALRPTGALGGLRRIFF